MAPTKGGEVDAGGIGGFVGLPLKSQQASVPIVSYLPLAFNRFVPISSASSQKKNPAASGGV